MAIVALNLTLYDSKDQESTVTLYSSDTFSIVTLKNAVLALIPLLGVMIRGGFRPKATLAVDVDLTASGDFATYDTPADDDADVEEGLFTQFNTAEPRSIRSGRVPTIDETLFLPGTREPDPADSRWIAWQAAMISGLTGINTGSGTTTVTFNDQYGNDITSLRDAYEQFQGSRKR